MDEDTAANIPDKTDPDFQGITLSSADSETLTPEQVYEKVSVSMVSVLATSIGNTTESGSSVSQEMCIRDRMCTRAFLIGI